MESIYKALEILKKYKIDKSDDINKYINYANQINECKPRYELDDIDIKIIKCIMNPNNQFKITKYGSELPRTTQGVKLKEIFSNINIQLEDERKRIYGLIVSGYIEPVIPITDSICKVSDAVTKLGIKSNTEEYTNLMLVLYKSAWLVEELEEVDLSLSQEGYESYIRILYSELYSYEETINEIVKNTMKKNDEFVEKIKKSEENLQIVEKSLKDATTQSITILGIFAGVVMAFTGGISYISQALVSLNNIGPYRAGVFISLIGVLIFNVIFLLFYMMGKLTYRYIGSADCKCADNKTLCKNKRINCSVKRYPYAIWFNLIGLVIITTILILCFLDRYNLFVKRFVDMTTSFTWYKLIQNVVIGACFFSIYGMFAYIIKKIFKIKCNNDEINS